jgi:putative transposase
MVEEILAVRKILVSYETVRQWALKFGQSFANQIRRRLLATGDKWHLSYFLSGIGQQFTIAPSTLLDVEVRLTLG